MLSAKAQVLLLEDVIVSNGLKSIPAQTHVQPGIQQDHVYDAGKPHPPSTLNTSKRCSCAAARRHVPEAQHLLIGPLLSQVPHANQLPNDSMRSYGSGH